MKCMICGRDVCFYYIGTDRFKCPECDLLGHNMFHGKINDKKEVFEMWIIVPINQLYYGLSFNIKEKITSVYQFIESSNDFAYDCNKMLFIHEVIKFNSVDEAIDITKKLLKLKVFA